MTHYIAIIDISEAEEEYKVVNAVVLARPDDSVYFFNETNHEAKVKFDTKAPFGDGKLDIPKKSKSGAHGLSTPGHYPFSVYVGETEATASKPIIIIYD